MTSTDHEERIRQRAYKLWQEGGFPNGRDVELWEQAEDLVAIEENPDAGQLPISGDRDPAFDGVEEAEIQESYGEVPGRLTDQGDRPQTPSRQARRSSMK
jgi:hypothetical protein